MLLAVVAAIPIVMGACVERGASVQGGAPAGAAPEDAGARAVPMAEARPSSSLPPPAKVRSMWGPDLTSGLRIPARKRFVFAGGQERGFQARATNNGTVPVTIRGDLDGVVREVGTIGPGEMVVADFGAREAALFDNASDVEAGAKVEVWGEASVGMRYLDLR